MCNEADAYLIMDQDNPARACSRGRRRHLQRCRRFHRGNSPFQTVWLPEDVRDSYLAKIRARADQSQKHIGAVCV